MNDAATIAEEILVLRCQAGDAWAFERLVAEYAAKLKYYVRRLVGAGAGGVRVAEADDVVQEVWLAVWRQLPKLREPKAFRAWLYRIARNMALQSFRGRIAEVPLDENHPAPATGEEEAFGPEDAAAIHAGLDQLSPPHREVLVLRFLEGMAYDAIADVTGASMGTVRSRIHYAKKALRRVMEVSSDE